MYNTNNTDLCANNMKHKPNEQSREAIVMGDASKARRTFGWEPKITFKELVKDMIEADLELMKKDPTA